LWSEGYTRVAPGPLITYLQFPKLSSELLRDPRRPQPARLSFGI